MNRNPIARVALLSVGAVLLGERRAEAVKGFLVQLGIASSRVQIISYGKERPFALGHDEKAWAQNCRDHFLVTAN